MCGLNCHMLGVDADPGAAVGIRARGDGSGAPRPMCGLNCHMLGVDADPGGPEVGRGKKEVRQRRGELVNRLHTRVSSSQFAQRVSLLSSASLFTQPNQGGSLPARHFMLQPMLGRWGSGTASLANTHLSACSRSAPVMPSVSEGRVESY